MTQRIHRFALPGILFLTVVAVAVLPSLAADEVTLSGSFVWERPDEKIDGELDVVFTPSGEGEWRVTFRFDWEGKPRVFEGTAKGSLTGDLTGDVDSDDPGHPLKFEFRGSFSDGTFSGTHGYFSKGELVDAGTLEFAPAG